MPQIFSMTLTKCSCFFKNQYIIGKVFCTMKTINLYFFEKVKFAISLFFLFYHQLLLNDLMFIIGHRILNFHIHKKDYGNSFFVILNLFLTVNESLHATAVFPLLSTPSAYSISNFIGGWHSKEVLISK